MTQNYTIKDIIDKVKKNKRWPDVKLIQRAYNYAVEKHGDQKRKSGEPYIIHPTNVAYTIAELGLDEKTICAALLHDVVEDTDATYDDIEKEFGTEIAEMVDGVTKLKLIQHASIEENQVENYRKMFLAMGKDIRVIIIKLADRLHNMRTLEYLKRDRQIAIAQETMQLYAPLANRLGLYSMKWELEDLGFKYLHPEEYRELIKGIEQKREERLKFIEKIMADIRVQLKKQHIEAEVTGRAKHLYSIYRKMERDNKTLDQIYDLFALRIIVNSVKDCYAALGVVHEMYSPMPGRFKDYIAVPKTNMYQSIHTTLLGEKGTPFEVQIRTWDMHRIAEYGIAAHWAYKEANYGSKKGQKVVAVQEDKLAWLRETLEWQQEMQDPQQFLETLKTELFEDEVYVFTPKGAIKVLPRGATPIDFAYSIHAEIGNHMVGAKINSKMVPIITPIKNGDIVEILTSDNSKGPSMDWLKFVKSSAAKNKIMSWFKKEKKSENIEKGKELIEKELKRIGMPYADLFKLEYINPMLERYKYKSLEEMYAAVGFGAITAQKIIARMLIEYRKEHKEEPIEQKIEAFTDTKVVSSILNKTFNYKLRHYNLAIKINKEYNAQDFWDIASQYEKSIKKLRFEFNYPNLPRVTKNLNSALKNASEIVNSTRSAIEFNAEEKKTLQNINANNKTINGLVKASAEGGTPIKMRVKGYKKYVETGNKAKTIEFDLDLSTKNIEEVKDILRELKE